MNCQSVKSLLLEFGDERLDASTAWQVQTHLSDCAACEQARRDLDSVSRLLGALPARQPSARFEDALAQRLALTRRPAAAPLSRRSQMVQAFMQALRPHSASAALRPALALGLVIAAGTFAAFFPASTAPQAGPPAATRAADPVFVADCVAQHHRDAAAEPLADLSAQTLDGSLDGSTPPDSPSDSSLF